MIGLLDLVIGFEDGFFGIWRFNIYIGEFFLLFCYDKFGSGKLMVVVYCYLYFFIVILKGFIILYLLGINFVDVI